MVYSLLMLPVTFVTHVTSVTFIYVTIVAHVTSVTFLPLLLSLLMLPHLPL